MTFTVKSTGRRVVAGFQASHRCRAQKIHPPLAKLRLSQSERILLNSSQGFHPARYPEEAQVPACPRRPTPIGKDIPGAFDFSVGIPEFRMRGARRKRDLLSALSDPANRDEKSGGPRGT